jgi:hypothetical protein
MRIALALLMLLLVPAGAHAASVAYVDNGEVWLASLDGAQKVRLAAPVVTAEGKTEKWLAVAQSDSGRIVAARNEPGRISRFSWFKVWEPDGTSTVEGPLNAINGFATYAYPLSFDVTADGKHMVYGYSNAGFCCPIPFARGTYVRPVTNSTLDPISLSGREWPTLFGSRVIAADGSTVSVQDAASTYDPDFTGWLDTSEFGLDLRRTDLAANGTLAAIELERWDDGSKVEGKVGVLSANGVGPLPDPLPVYCFLPAAGVAEDASLSQDARAIAWTDDGGLKVAGTPTTAADPCVLTSGPVTLAATGESPSIGPANVAAFLPPAPPAPPAPTSPPTPTTTPVAAPTFSVPAKLTAKSLTKGIGLKVKVAAAGKVRITATVKKRVIATGSATAKAAGTVTVKLKLNAAGKKLRKRLKGAKATLKVTHGGRTTTRTVKLR